MADEINFLDLAALLKIAPDTTVEKYGSLINSSLFDAANVLGSLNNKKLISFTTAFPNQNPIAITDLGKQVIAEANEKANLDFDHLDLSILNQLNAGKSALPDISGAINVRPRDLAMHLFKLAKQGFMTYDFRNGSIKMMLTDKGFAQAKAGMPVKPAPAPMQAPGPAPAQMRQPGTPMPMKPPQTTAQQPPQVEEEIPEDQRATPMPAPQQAPATAAAPEGNEQIPSAGERDKIKKERNILRDAIIIIIIVIIILLGYYAYTQRLI